MIESAAWTSAELERIGAAEELEIATLRRDGTLRAPLPVWVVRTGVDLYVRSVNGRSAAWFRHVQASGEGRVRVGDWRSAAAARRPTFRASTPTGGRRQVTQDSYRNQRGDTPCRRSH